MVVFTKSEWLNAQFTWRQRRRDLLRGCTQSHLVEVVVKPRDTILAPLLALTLAQMRPDLSVIAAGTSQDAGVSLWPLTNPAVSALSYAPCFETGIISSSVSIKEALSNFDVVFWQSSSPEGDAQTSINTREGMLPYFSTAPGSFLADLLKESRRSLELTSKNLQSQPHALGELFSLNTFPQALGGLAKVSKLQDSNQPDPQEESLIKLLFSMPGIFEQPQNLREESKLLALIRLRVPSASEKETLTRLLKDAKHSGDLLTLIELTQALEI